MAAGVAWWIALFWLWMLLVGDWNRIEWIAGACAATIGAALAEHMRRALELRFRISLNRLPSLVTALGMVVVDFGILTWVVFQSVARRRVHRGSFVRRRFDVSGAGNRALTMFAANFSPNAYVVDVDPHAHEVVLHDLVPYRRSEEPA
jgi:multisubunit Na+/H+ antiporter MnhE subunit